MDSPAGTLTGGHPNGRAARTRSPQVRLGEANERGHDFTVRTRKFPWKPLVVVDDSLMNTNDLRVRQSERRLADPIDVAAQARTSLLVIAGVSIAIIGAVLAVAARPDHEILLIFGLGLFIAGTAIGITFVEPGDRLSDGNASRIGAGGFHGSSMQLGPDPEQVIGRKTGTRI